ncbi:MAG: hypothetical protein LBM75_10995 [Myxococcales bacterium]|jgi:hypothetical protein|nr:hypothetical protein [Myxococcales bacterium]
MRLLRLLPCALLAASLSLFAAACADDPDDPTADTSAPIVEALPSPLPAENLTTDAALIRLAPSLFTNLNRNWKDLASIIIDVLSESIPMLNGAHFNEADNLVVPINLPCMDILGFGALCDMNDDGICDEDETCEIDLIAKRLSIAPNAGTEPSSANATAQIEFSLKTPVGGLPIAALGASCGLNYDSTKMTTASLGLDVVLDPKAPHLLGFELSEVRPDVYLDGIGSLSNNISVSGGGLCFLLSIGTVILPTLDGLIQNALKDAVDKASAQACIFKTNDESDLDGVCASGQTCACYSGDAPCERADLRCRDDATGAFPSMFPGWTGRVHIGQALAAFGVDPTAAFDFSVAAGGGTLNAWGTTTSGVKTGQILLGTLAGARAHPDAMAPCVPEMTPPQPVELSGSFDLSQGPEGHQVAIALSEHVLNEALYQATRAGALCLDIGTETVALLSSTLFAGFVPSLSLLGQDLPMSLALRPAKAPRIVLGKGVVGGNGAIEEPLLTLVIEDLSIDVHAFLDERYVRLFTLNVDVVAPVAAELGTNASGQTTIKPILGQLSSMLVFNTAAETNSELLTEDIATLGAQLGTLLSLGDSFVGGLLTAYPLPDVAGLRISVDGLTGVGTGVDGDYAYLGAFLSVAPATE